MQATLRDVRYGVRTLRKNPALTIVAVTALTLGIGLTTTMFSIVYGAMLKGLPYPDGDRIMVMYRTNPSRGVQQQSLSIQEYYDYKAQQRSFRQIGAWTSGTMNVSGSERAERFDGSWVTASTFDLIGVRPILGRNFRSGEDAPGGEHVAIISYFMWQTRYSGDRAIVGKSIRVNGSPYTVIGVMPEKFDFPQGDKIWLSLQIDPLATKRGEGPGVEVFGKLKPDVSLDEANVEMATIAKRLALTYPEAQAGFSTMVRPFVDSYIGKEPRSLLYTMLGAVFLVLLIACANVANLLLDRAAHRSKEVGIRTALGASRGAVVRQFLTEALVLSMGGAVFGIGVAYVGIGMFNRAIAVTQVPFFIDIRLHPAVLAFTIAVAFVASLVSGAIPAYQSSRTDINEVLKDETRGASSFRIGKMSKALVVFEIALSCGLLVAAGLMIKSVAKLRTMDPGFATKSIFTARVGFPSAYADTAQQKQFFTQAVQRVSAIPGVQSAAVSSGLPAARIGMGRQSFAIDGKSYTRDQDYPDAHSLSVTPGFFATLELPITAGRGFTDGDREGTLPVAIVNRAFVAKFLPGVDPIGRRIRIGRSKSTAPWLSIVGVVPDVFGGDNEDPKPAAIFQPFAQAHSNFAYIAARTAGPPLGITSAVRDAVADLNPDIPLYWVDTLDGAIAQQLWFVRVFGTMFMIFGFVALFLASVGLYAVMAFSVSRRTREVGIRMALGAQSRDVVRMIFGQGLLQLGIGITAGLALATGISQLLKIILFQVQPRDPMIFGGVAATLIGVGLLACFLPARRATRVDPLVALRAE